MIHLSITLQTLVILVVIATLTWFVSTLKRDVSIVDSVWSLFFLAVLIFWWTAAEAGAGPRALPAFMVVGAWAIRLSIHLTLRNWGHGEDRRYQKIRERYEPMFWLKSLGIIFLFQAMLAGVVALPLFSVMTSHVPIGTLDWVGLAVFISGLAFESIADVQLMAFKKNHPSGGILSTGLWRYSRHPNYFGEAVLWWGLYAVALSAGAPWWMIISPALMTWLLLKFSGVPLLEEDLKSRRPDYQSYIETTSAFIPLPPRKSHE